MLIDKTGGHLGAVKEFAKSVGADAELQKRLDYLDGYAKHRETRCFLFKDFAPQSFLFTIEVKEGEEWKYWFNGGLIYSGPGQPHDGSFPALTVNISPSKKVHDWSIHT